MTGARLEEQDSATKAKGLDVLREHMTEEYKKKKHLQNANITWKMNVEINEVYFLGGLFWGEAQGLCVYAGRSLTGALSVGGELGNI